MDSASFVPMKCKNYLFVGVLLISIFLCSKAYAQDARNDQHINIAMRSIGHEVMLAHGDRTSRVLPIKKEGNQYFIQFNTEFVFQASKLVEVIDKVVKRTDLATNYLIEMQDCQSNEIIYSYQVIGEVDPNTIPCGLREQAKACYILRFLIMNEEQNTMWSQLNGTKSLTGLSTWCSRIISSSFFPISFLLFIGMGLYFYRKKSQPTNSSDVIAIGNYVFDPKSMTLSLSNNTIELSGKESHLLSFLYLSVNTTVGREDILRNVWGNEGDYVGRTLDVFISKLRKKLEDDPRVKIANIRGVGYRLVLDASK